MVVQSQNRILEVESIGEIMVAKFLVRKLLDEKPIELVGRELMQMVKEQGCRKLLLDFGQVERLATVLVGKIVALHKAAQAAGGRLALCHIRPEVEEIFTILNLRRILHIYADEQEALQSF